MANDNRVANAHRPFICDECSKVFTRSENLQRHKRACHGGASHKTYQCTRCEARFSRSDVYKRHTTRCNAVTSPNKASQPEVVLWKRVQQAGVGTATPLNITQDTNESITVTDNFWKDGHEFATDLPRTFPSPTSAHNTPNTSIDPEEAHVKVYFEHFHPSLPLLHRPTFSVSSSPRLLVKATALIGGMISARSGRPEEVQAHLQWCQEMWHNGQNELQDMVSKDWNKLREPWVMQTWLLYIIRGAYATDTVKFETAKRMLRDLIDAVREIGLSQEAIAMPGGESWMSVQNGIDTDSQTLYTRWRAYINSESMRLCLYTLVFLDSNIFSPCNSRPLMSPIEFGWELPFPNVLWEARNSQIWQQRADEYFGRTAALSMTSAIFHYPRSLATGSLSTATQQLMTEEPGSELTTALEASPFATFCVLANLSALVRDFTRCYYQMPPSASDPSAFHVLTQAQNKQIHAALRAIAKIVKNQAYTSDSPQFHLWRKIELSAFSVRVSLCRPDQLLIGGIVDNNLIAGLAASTHLAQGNYVAIRRSLPLIPQDLSDEGILAILHDLSSALFIIFGEDQKQVILEAPWATVTSYGILLCIWGAVKRAAANIRHHMNTFNELPRTHESCMLIFNTLMESVILNCSPNNNRRDPRLWSTDQQTLKSLVEEGETILINLIKSFCQQRCIWGIGPSMLAVMGEIPGLEE